MVCADRERAHSCGVQMGLRRAVRNDERRSHPSEGECAVNLGIQAFRCYDFAFPITVISCHIRASQALRRQRCDIALGPAVRGVRAGSEGALASMQVPDCDL